MSVGWIATHSGRRFYPLNPNPDDVNIGDIAHALSNLCRYTGHTRRFYSVAEHSLLVSANCPSGFELEGLLHDAAEAYLADIARPIKHLLTGIQEVEDRIYSVIANKYGVPTTISQEVKAIDYRICEDERDQLMLRSNAAEWWPEGTPRRLGVNIECMAPYAAETRFIMEFHRLTEWIHGNLT